MEKQQIVKKRIEWVDIAKAITIILVIVGHTVGGLSIAIIYSFHMPLFFILSAYTFKCSENKEQFVNKTEKAFKHLIIPVLILIFIGTCKNIVIQFPNMNNWNFILLFAKREILKWCFASGCDVQILFRNIEGIGMPWFLVVLFIGRTLFDYLHQKLSDKKLFIWCCILSALGVVIGKIQFLPLSFDIVLAIMPLFYIGHKLDYFDIKTNCTKKNDIFVNYMEYKCNFRKCDFKFIFRYCQARICMVSFLFSYSNNGVCIYYRIEYYNFQA